MRSLLIKHLKSLDYLEKLIGHCLEDLEYMQREEPDVSVRKNSFSEAAKEM